MFLYAAAVWLLLIFLALVLVIQFKDCSDLVTPAATKAFRVQELSSESPCLNTISVGAIR